MRIFFAVEFDDYTKNKLSEIVQNVRPCIEKGNMTNTDNFHLTLCFIGETDQAGLEKLKTCAAKVKNAEPFELHFSQPGIFHKKGGDILWAGIEKSPRLEALFAELSGSLNEIGYKPDNEIYRPHITLGRSIKFINNGVDLKNIIQVPPIVYAVNNFSLMESLRVNGVLTYRHLAVYPLIH